MWEHKTLGSPVLKLKLALRKKSYIILLFMVHENIFFSWKFAVFFYITLFIYVPYYLMDAFKNHLTEVFLTNIHIPYFDLEQGET